MTRLDIAIEYLTNHPELIGELARLSWKEWQEIYQQREQTLEDCLKNYQERMNTESPRRYRMLKAFELKWRRAKGKGQDVPGD